MDQSAKDAGTLEALMIRMKEYRLPRAKRMQERVNAEKSSARMISTSSSEYTMTVKTAGSFMIATRSTMSSGFAPWNSTRKSSPGHWKTKKHKKVDLLHTLFRHLA